MYEYLCICEFECVHMSMRVYVHMCVTVCVHVRVCTCVYAQVLVCFKYFLEASACLIGVT
jgi:hypothetical protein